jgi:hypothetical protein
MEEWVNNPRGWNYTWAYNKEITEIAKENWWREWDLFEDMPTWKQVIVKNQNALDIKTESQLHQIWQQANKTK